MAYFRCTGNSGGSLKLRTAQGEIASFETNLPEPYPSVTVNVVAMGGNGTPDNPNPIVGYSSANITRCGKNFANIKPYANWTIGSDYAVLLNTLPSNTMLFMSLVDNDTSVDVSGCYFGFCINDSSNPSANYRWILNNGNKIEENNFKNNEYMSGLFFYPKTEETYNKIFSRYKVQIELGDLKTDYVPYNGQTYAIAFGQMVYGGSLDVTRGKLTDTFDDSELSDITGWSYANGFFRTSALASIIKKPASQLTAVNAICPIYNNVSWQAAGDNDYEYAVNAVNGELIIKDSRYTDVSSFLAGVSGVPFAYELATPFDIDLTHVQIRASVGENNVFADTGDTEVKYLNLE